MSTAISNRATRTALRREKLKLLKHMKLLYVMMIGPLIILVIFRYIPIYGIVIAFKDYSYGKGIVGSNWNNFEHFRFLFESHYFIRILKNTIIISMLKLVIGFPMPVLLAIMINEIRSLTFKKVVQSISYLPHFLSWVVLSGIIIEIVSPTRGIVGHIYALLGRSAPNVLTSTVWFRPLLVVTEVWQSVGWGSIVYIAATSSIDPQLYESASIDGAGRFKQAYHITIPCLVPVMTILFILRLGRLLNAGFDQIFNLYNPLVYSVADIIDTYVYRVGLIERQFDFGVAVGVFKNVIGVALILGANAIIRKFSDYGVW